MYFGRGTHADALALYNAQKDDLHAGRTPRDDDAEPGTLTIVQLSSEWLTTKEAKRDANELSQRTFDDYTAVAKLVCKHLGRNRLVADLRPADFQALRSKLARKWGPVRLGNVVKMIRQVFDYGADPEKRHRPPCPSSTAKAFRHRARRRCASIERSRGPTMTSA